MKQKKTIIFLLALLLIIKYIYLPWDDWATQKQETINQLRIFNEKQKQAVENKGSLTLAFKKNEQHLEKFVSKLPSINLNEKADPIWFTLFEEVKSKDLKIYNQKIEFEDVVTENVSYVVGSLAISGDASDVIKAILTLEEKSPYVFFDSLNLSRPGGGKRNKIVAQLHVGYWFQRKGGNNDIKSL